MLFIKYVRAICLANFQYSSYGMGVLNSLSTTRRFYLRIWTRINKKKKIQEISFCWWTYSGIFNFYWEGWQDFHLDEGTLPVQCRVCWRLTLIYKPQEHPPFVVLCTLNTSMNLGSRVYTGKNLKLNLSLCSPWSYEGWNFNSGNSLFTTDTKWIHVSKFYCPSV